MREDWCSWTSVLLFLCAQVHCLYRHLEGWRACDCGWRRGQGRVAWAALRVLPDPPPPPPAKARKTPAQRYQPAEGPAGLSSRGFLAPFVAGGSPGTESRAPLADPDAATRRDRPLPRDPARPPAPGRPPPTPRPGDDAGRGERTERSARVVALPPSPRPGTGDRTQVTGVGGPSPDRLAQTPAPLPCGAYAGSNPRNAHGGTEHARSRARRHAAKQLRTHAHRRGSPGR